MNGPADDAFGVSRADLAWLAEQSARPRSRPEIEALVLASGGHFGACEACGAPLDPRWWQIVSKITRCRIARSA